MTQHHNTDMNAITLLTPNNLTDTSHYWHIIMHIITLLTQYHHITAMILHYWQQIMTLLTWHYHIAVTMTWHQTETASSHHHLHCVGSLLPQIKTQLNLYSFHAHSRRVKQTNSLICAQQMATVDEVRRPGDEDKPHQDGTAEQTRNTSCSRETGSPEVRPDSHTCALTAGTCLFALIRKSSSGGID